MGRLAVIVGLVASTVTWAACRPPPPVTEPPVAQVVQPAPPERQTYQVKLRRPRQPGDRENIHYVAMEKQTKVTRVGPQVVGEETKARRVELEGLLTVRDVNEPGQVIASQIVVQKCTAQTSEGVRELARSGQVLEIVRGDPPTVTLDQQPVSEDDQDLFDLVLSLDPPAPPTEDEALGSSQPVQVGASWPIDAQLTAASMSRPDMVLDPARLRGQTSVLGVEDVDGRECLDVQVLVEIRGVQMANLPPNATLLSSEMQVQMRALFPTDLVTPPVRDEAAMRLHFQIGVAREGPQGVIDLTVERHELKLSVPAS